MTGDLLLGIDIGTTGVRCAAFERRGHLLAEASADCAPDTSAPGRAEAEPEGWWRAVCAVIANLGLSVTLADIGGVGVVGQAPTAVLVDIAGRPLRRAILWLDLRAEAQASELASSFGSRAAEALGGNRIHAYFLGPKLAWLAAHEPQVLERAAWVLQSHSFVVLRLTNEATCDESTAMLCAPLFDAGSRRWSSDAARAVGIAPELLPRVVRAHDVIGAVTREASQATGLREGTPVVAGGGDFASAALGSGVVEQGQGCLMLGTAGNLLMPMVEPRFDSRLINSRHVGCDRWLALGGTLCGAALEWFRRTCARGETWEALEAEAARVACGAEGLLFLPYLQGERTPIWDARARAVMFGAGLAHGRGHLYRALIEGIALGFRHCLAVAHEHDLRLHEVAAANGAGRSALLRQTLCNALGVPLTWDGSTAATVVGAAALAGLGIGALADSSAVRGWPSRGPRTYHVPEPEAHARLEDVFARRLALCEALRVVFAESSGPC